MLLLVEDHALVGQGLRALLERDFEVLGPIREGTAVPEAVARARPDVLLLDLSLPGRNGLDLIPDVRRASPDTRILVVTMHADYLLARSAFALGALGFMPKDCDVDELKTAITEVLAGRRYLSPRIPPHAVTGPASPARQTFWKLTPRQQEILRAIGEGRTTEALSEQLGLSIHTIHFHRRNIRRVLGIETEDGLTRYALMMQFREEGQGEEEQP